jgi:hypothetical protein
MRALAATGLILALALGAFLGAAVALRAAPATVDQVALGTVATRVEPALRGSVGGYAPLVDWGARVRPFRAPLSVQLEFRALDRTGLLESLASGAAAQARLQLLRGDLERVVGRALLRAGLVGAAGALAGGLLAGAIVGAALHRRRWLAYGLAAGAACAVASAGLLALDVTHPDRKALVEPTFYARGDELPQILAFGEQLLVAGPRYTESYEAALQSLTNLIAVGGGPLAAVEPLRTAVVASDLHSNTLVLPALARFAAGTTLFFVGDFTELGTGIESRIAPAVAQAGGRVVAVSGNHDSAAFMRALAAEGATVLTQGGILQPDGTVAGSPVVETDGLLVAGWADSLERDGPATSHRLKLSHVERESESARLVAWFDGLPQRPDAVLVHQHGLAHALLDHVAADDAGAPLLILTGHDHVQHHEVAGPHVLVDGGTVGAGGPFGAGVDSAGFARLHLAGARLQALDLIEIEPLHGGASARRVVLDADRPTIPLLPGS